MMLRVTSVFDLFNKAEKDERYRRLVIEVYKDACYPPPIDISFEKAKRWMDDWLTRNVKPTSRNNSTCWQMVDYANDRIGRIDHSDNPLRE